MMKVLLILLILPNPHHVWWVQGIQETGQNWHKISKDQIDRLKRQDIEFKSYDIPTAIRELRNGSVDYVTGKIPVQVYISDNHFLQLTNLKNGDLWSTLPYTTELVEQVNQMFAVKELSVVSSTLKASSIPSSLAKLTLNQTRITDGTLSSVLQRCLSLETLLLRRSGDIVVSDLSSSKYLKHVDLTDLSVYYSANTNLNRLKHLKLHYGTFLDPRILQEFSAIFNGLSSIALDQTYFNILKRSLQDIYGLNWITIWKLDVGLISGDTVLDEILIQGVLEFRLTAAVELVKQNDRWRLLKYNE